KIRFGARTSALGGHFVLQNPVWRTNFGFGRSFRAAKSGLAHKLWLRKVISCCKIRFGAQTLASEGHFVLQNPVWRTNFGFGRQFCVAQNSQLKQP
ncbi:hypothetical protein, partial [Metabacillus idriensis]|uniref:hypothetical protein n=1 Tax=Metabacillus idriensis TaxID=324768 RepID=UPI003D27DA8C